MWCSTVHIQTTKLYGSGELVQRYLGQIMLLNGDDENGTGSKTSTAGDPAVLDLTTDPVPGTTVTLRYGCKNNHSGVKINGRDVALVGNNTRNNIDVDSS